VRSKSPYEIKYRLRDRNGVYRWYLNRAVPVRDAAGVVIKWVGTCTDIHDNKNGKDTLDLIIATMPVTV
jgi:PAS domain-containing protein